MERIAMAEYTYGKDFVIRTEEDCVATKNDYGYVGRITAVKIKTNADRIRSMSDEELLTTICVLSSQLRNKTTEQWLEWLRKEAEDG